MLQIILKDGFSVVLDKQVIYSFFVYTLDDSMVMVDTLTLFESMLHSKFNYLFFVGNFMYFAATGPYMVMGSRLIAGLGSGSGSSILGMISRSTSNEERTAAFSQLMSLRQMGLIIGPAFNIFLAKLDFYIGNFHVNSLTSPGVSDYFFRHKKLIQIQNFTKIRVVTN